MKTTAATIALLTVICFASLPAQAQRSRTQRNIASAEARYRTVGGEAAVKRFRAELAAKEANELKAADWGEALQHPEEKVRMQAMRELVGLARNGEDIVAAMPTLKEVAFRKRRFPTQKETDDHSKKAVEILAIVDPDVVAGPLAEVVGALLPRNHNGASHFALDTLMKINPITVDVDAPLLKALDGVLFRTEKEQSNGKYLEGRLLYVLAKLGTDRDKVGKAVLARMRWPLATARVGYYTDDHFRAVRLCAEQCGPMFPGLKQGYLTDELQRQDALKLIPALAVYHDDAWEFFSQAMQDRFASHSRREQMLTTFADTWLHASEPVQQASLERMSALAPKISDWRFLNTTSLVSRLGTSFLNVDKGERDVVGRFRKESGIDAH